MLLPVIGQEWAERIARARLCWIKENEAGSQDQRIEKKPNYGEGPDDENVPLLRLNKTEGWIRYSLRKEATYIRVGLSRGHKLSALMHTSFTRWAAKSFRLHGRRTVTIIPRAFSNSDTQEGMRVGQVTGCCLGFCRLEGRQI